MNITALKIRIFGDSALRKKSLLIKEVKAHHREVLSQMSRLMYESQGIGLAAPQVGINESMIVVDTGSGLYKLINPRIIKKTGSQVTEEGCLSVPGVCIKVRRSGKITLKALDDQAKPLEIKAEGLLACVFQHEIDHLHGKMIVDYANFLQKLKIKRRLEQLRKKAEIEKQPESAAKSCKLQL
jgi:peptide deformylase